MASAGVKRVGECSIAIVMPAYNAVQLLPEVVPAALRAADGAAVLVVDPGSTDGTARAAEQLGARVVRLPHRAGPARARNIGVAHVDADIVLFLDADCVVRADVVERVRAAFAAEPELVCLTGSYDDSPRDPGFFSQYMNLRHHYTHQRAKREDATFWAGCGAVRREAFLAVGGFDARRFPRPQIEDIELGYRLRQVGRARLDPELQVTHLKRWTLRGTVYTDIVERGIPWTELMLELGEVPNDLSLRTSQRIAAALAPFALLGVGALPVALLTSQGALALVALFAVGVALALQADFVAQLARLRGPLFAARARLFHQVHLSYSGLTFAICWSRHRLRAASSARRSKNSA
jgi:GT2 family glycosyltransferase